MLLVRQAAMTSLQVERLQASIVSGGDVDPEMIIRLANTQTRSLQELGLGLKRGKGAVAPSGQSTLANYMASIAAAQDEAVEPADHEEVAP
jgi:hypothetical protein